jgi:hypothetical protein
MAYYYTAIELESIDESGANLRPVKAYLPGPVPLVPISIGERLRLTITFAKTAPSVPKFKDGQTFAFNIKLFADEIHSLAPKGTGWRIQVKQTPAGKKAKATIDTGGREAIDQNITMQSVTLGAGDTEMTLVFDFFVTSDVTDWIGLNQITEQLNIWRWTRSNRASEDDLDNSEQSAFRALQSWIEVAIWEADEDLNPLTVQNASPQDPIVRDPLNPQFETFAMEVGLKWYDQVVGANNEWNTTTAKDDNWLKSVSVTAGNLGVITQVDQKGYPFDYDSVLRNFTFDVGDSTTQLVINNRGDATADKNNVTVVIGSPNYTDYTDLVCHLIRVDAPNELADFTKTYQLATANIPKLFPGVSVLDGPIETPSAWSVAAGELTIDLILNGEKLQAGGEYYLIFVLTKDDDGQDFSSSHITTSMSVTLANVNVPTVAGFIDTYNNSYGPTINDVSLANFERVKIGIIVDSNPYGPTFEDDLAQVRLRSILLGQNAIVSSKKFPAGLGVGSPEVIITDLGAGLWEFSATLRSYYAATVIGQSTHTWELEFTPSGFNQPDTWVGKFEQRLKHRPNDLIRLPNMRILDFSVFPGVLSPKTFICTNIDEFVVIELEKNGAPNANLIAMILQSGPNVATPTVLPSIEEAESYVGNLPQLSSTSITAVDVDFAAQLSADKAYYVVRVADLSPAKVFHALAINI